MKKTECQPLIKNMINSICKLPDTKNDTFIHSFTQLRNILHNEYFLPFDREDIYMIAIKLKSLYNSLLPLNNNSISIVTPLLIKIRDIIDLLDNAEKNKYKLIFKAITEYNNQDRDTIKLLIPDIDNTTIHHIIDICDDTVIQIEYTILKNS